MTAVIRLHLALTAALVDPAGSAAGDDDPFDNGIIVMSLWDDDDDDDSGSHRMNRYINATGKPGILARR